MPRMTNYFWFQLRMKEQMTQLIFYLMALVTSREAQPKADMLSGFIRLVIKGNMVPLFCHWHYFLELTTDWNEKIALMSML